MSLDLLPEELLIIIIKQLDLASVCNLFNTGNHHLQNVISSQGAIKKCRLSCSSMATVQTIKLNFFKSISKNLLNLDLSTVQDLTKTALLPAMKKMDRLVTLNVAYTNITILDLLDMYELCPTIKNITINHLLHKPSTKLNHLSQEILIKCQDLFANFDNVHFVGSIDNLLFSALPSNMLHKANLNSLTYTISQAFEMIPYNNIEKKKVHSNKVTLNMLYWKETVIGIPMKDFLEICPFEYEYVQIDECAITISPGFENFFKENFRYNRIQVIPHTFSLSRVNMYIMLWNKQTTKFDNAFFCKLAFDIRQLYPCMVAYTEGMAPVVLPNDWVYVSHPPLPDNTKKFENHGFKKLRVSSPNVTLDYDIFLKDKKTVKLSIFFYDHIKQAVTLSASSSFLRKLTFLQLRGTVRYSIEFFNILFRCCHSLVTLDVEGYPVSPCAPPISRSIPLSQSIKNIRICDKNIDLNTLFSSFGQCLNLENIMIIDLSTVSNDVPVTDVLFKQCANLYRLCICGYMSDTARIKKLTMLNKAKKKYNRHHLSIAVFDTRCPEYSFVPFIDVFSNYLTYVTNWCLD